MVSGMERSGRVEPSDTIEAIEECYRMGWSDGLPVVPPVEYKVREMLEYVGMTGEEELLSLEMRNRVLTSENAAANAVMAGCLPEYFPVLISTLRTLEEEKNFVHMASASTSSPAILMIVNGPIRDQISMNSKDGLFGPGFRANACLGRSIRLCFMNGFDARPGVLDRGTLGNPSKYTLCIAENEEVSPWQPYHMDKGFKRDESAVTVVTVTGPTTIIDSTSRSHEDTLSNIASMMFYKNAGAGGWLRGWQSAQVGHTNKRVPYQGPYHPIILSPSRAVIMAEAGMNKQDAQAWLHEKCRISVQDAIGARGVPKNSEGKWLNHPELQHLENDPAATVPALESPDQYLLFVTGGSTHYAHFFYGTYGIATVPVEDV